ncbi:MAG: hypothetical protein QW745_08780 [Thermoplasmata archaeon]
MVIFAIRLEKNQALKDKFIAYQHLRHKKTAEEYLDYLLKLDEEKLKKDQIIYRW